MHNNSDENKSGLLIIILLFMVCILILFFPKIYDFINSFTMPKVEKLQTNEKEEIKEIDENVLETIHYPLMRTSIYNSYTYYSLDTFKIDNLSNNDILLNAFLDIYEGNMTSYENTGYCTTISKQFNEEYLRLRVKNIISNKVKYTLENFYVPEDLDSNYTGTWNYDSVNKRFVYIGLCNSLATNIKYYNLEQLIKIEYDNNDIDAYYYVGFAKVEGNNYIIYKDANMTQELNSGTFISLDDLNNIFENINKKNKKIYKYKFKNNLCSYNEYCLYEGKWINEL